MHGYDEEKRAEFICIRSGKSEAELALDVLYYIEARPTDRHEASRGLSARA